jgi:hypothetical protein
MPIYFDRATGINSLSPKDFYSIARIRDFCGLRLLLRESNLLSFLCLIYYLSESTPPHDTIKIVNSIGSLGIFSFELQGLAVEEPDEGVEGRRHRGQGQEVVFGPDPVGTLEGLAAAGPSPF